MPDGDLWQDFQNAVIAKGEQAVDATKVKGHAADQMVSEGYSSVYKECNDRSDHLATRGRTDSPIAGLVEICSNRQGSYADFMLKLALRNIDVFKEDQRLREARARVQHLTNGVNAKLKQIAINVGYPCLVDCRAINILPLDFWPASFTKGPSTSYRSVWAFLSQLQIKPAVLPESGVTWLELLLLFEQSGGNPDLRGVAHGPEARNMSVKRRLCDFQSFIRDVVKHFVHSNDQGLFKNPPAVQKRLMCLGFINHTPKLSFIPHVPGDKTRALLKVCYLCVQSSLTT